MNQSYENHRKIDPLYVGGITVIGFITLILSFVFFFRHIGSQWLLSAILLLFAVLFVLIIIKLRGYALQLQDRLIRSEENFRYFRLTGNVLDASLSMKHIAALRFSEDEEFPDLVERAVLENLSPDDIKKAVVNWRGDHHRV
ncbi:hypothetical protein GJU40_17800 [Bacillus lacus]|uniref:Uncharacterized protein n=1 Tax=Metabacillus lacus TaxID=1983721 RepID=A0A7X2M106_9BACI|nr:hypothetical protein [Metabacillus lacus]